MKQCVDKEEEREIPYRKLEVGSLFAGDCLTDNHLAAIFADLIGEDIWDICFAAQSRVERLRGFLVYKCKRNIPAGENLTSNLVVH